MANGNPDYLVTIQQEGTGISVIAPMSEEFMFDTSSDYAAPFAQGLMGNNPMTQLARLGGIRLSSQALTAQIWQGSNDTTLSLELDFQAETDAKSEVRDPVINLMRLTTPKAQNGIMRAPGPQFDTSFAPAVAEALKDNLSETWEGAVAGYEAGSEQAKLNKAIQEGQAKIQKSVMSNAGASVPAPLQGLTQAKNSDVNKIGDANFWKNKIKNKISIRVGNMAFFDCVVITQVQKTIETIPDAASGLSTFTRVQLQFRPMFQLLESDLDQVFSSGRASGLASAGASTSSLETRATNAALLGMRLAAKQF